jgi:hypothetical protein
VKRGLLAAVEQRGLAAKRRRGGGRAHARTILRDAVEAHQTLVQEAREHVAEELVERALSRRSLTA